MNIVQHLFEMQDIEYREFHSKLMPTVNKESIIGVRTPMLRKYAKELNWTKEAEDFLNTLPHTYYEENNLHAFLLESIKDYDKCIEAINAFLPHINNWATCDMMSPTVFKKHRDKLFEQIKIWIDADDVYTIRFAVKTLMSLYLDEYFDEIQLEMVASVTHEDYYVKMVVAWYFATALAKQYEATLPYIKDKRLELWTHNKAIQKAKESYRVSKEHKEELEQYRIKK
ncbi:MAG: DNA alkylation repair protein [Lachnospiraceae bacterium]|nr:DNA alkylation repair protein [Lachnospiraceae bacterium]